MNSVRFDRRFQRKIIEMAGGTKPDDVYKFDWYSCKFCRRFRTRQKPIRVFPHKSLLLHHLREEHADQIRRENLKRLRAANKVKSENNSELSLRVKNKSLTQSQGTVRDVEEPQDIECRGSETRREPQCQTNPLTLYAPVEAEGGECLVEEPEKSWNTPSRPATRSTGREEIMPLPFVSQPPSPVNFEPAGEGLEEAESNSEGPKEVQQETPVVEPNGMDNSGPDIESWKYQLLFGDARPSTAMRRLTNNLKSESVASPPKQRRAYKVRSKIGRQSSGNNSGSMLKVRSIRQDYRRRLRPGAKRRSLKTRTREFEAVRTEMISMPNVDTIKPATVKKDTGTADASQRTDAQPFRSTGATTSAKSETTGRIRRSSLRPASVCTSPKRTIQLTPKLRFKIKLKASLGNGNVQKNGFGPNVSPAQGAVQGPTKKVTQHPSLLRKSLRSSRKMRSRATSIVS